MNDRAHLDPPQGPQPPHAPRGPLDRRRFVQSLGSLGLLGLAGAFSQAIVPGEGGAQPRPATPPPGGTGAPPAAAPPAAAPPATPPEVKAEAAQLLAILRGRYGAQIGDAEAASLGEALEGTVQSGRALRARKLDNAVEPDTVFRAVEPKPAGGSR